MPRRRGREREQRGGREEEEQSDNGGGGVERGGEKNDGKKKVDGSTRILEITPKVSSLLEKNAVLRKAITGPSPPKAFFFSFSTLTHLSIHHALRFQALLQGAGTVDCWKGRGSAKKTQSAFLRLPHSIDRRALLPFSCSIPRASRAEPAPIAHRMDAGDRPELIVWCHEAGRGFHKVENRARKKVEKAAARSAAAAAAAAFESLTSFLFSSSSLSSSLPPLKNLSNSTTSSSASCSTPMTRPSSSTPTTSARGSSWTFAG